MSSFPLVVPFTFPNGYQSGDETLISTRALVDESCSDSRAIRLTSWIRNPASGSASPSSGSDFIQGAAIGCEDGSLFLFQRPVDHHFPPDISLESRDATPTFSRPSSPLRHGHTSRSRSRSTTPSSLSGFSPLNIASRSRIVSGVNTDQVQAPRNYVDYDEEPEKLKELLKGGVRETTVTDRLSLPSFDKGLTIEKPAQATGTPSSFTTLRLADVNTLPSPPHLTLAAITKSPSVVSSPNLHPSASPHLYGLGLERHVFPPIFGRGCAVSELQPFNSGHHILSLQTNG